MSTIWSSRARKKSFCPLSRRSLGRIESPSDKPTERQNHGQWGPIPAVHGVVRWRIIDLCQWMFEEFRVVVAKQTLSRELRAMGYRKLSARPRHHAQAEGAIEDFKKASPRAWTRSGARRASSPPP